MEIVVSKKSYKRTDMAYWVDCRTRGVLDLTGESAISQYKLFNGIMSKDECTPEFMLGLIKSIDPLVCLEAFLKIRPENEIPEEVKIAAARAAQWGIFHKLQNPSPAVINAALETAGEWIVDMKKRPTKQQWLVALQHSREYPDLITKCPKPTIQMQKIHVAKYLDGIKYINKPTEEVKIAAAKANSLLGLKYIPNPSEQVILAAISNWWSSTQTKDFLRYIPRPNHKIMCAIRHQIKLTKKFRAQIELEKEPSTEPTESKIGILRKQCILLDPLRTVQACSPDKPVQDQIPELEQLEQELSMKTLMDLIGRNAPAISR